jgi:hypothetical protein
MIRVHRLRGRLLVAMALAVAGTGPSARAQRDVPEIEIDEAVPRPRSILVSDEQLDRWVFGSGGAGESRRRLEWSLTSHLNDVDRICSLTAVQKNKLLLAGRGDIKRFFDHVEETRTRIHHEWLDRVELQAILQEFQRRAPNSRPELFGEKSLFSKSLKNTLTAEQFGRYQKVTRDGSVARHRATITWVVGVMDNTLRLSEEQHRQLEELLAKETRPPKKFGEYDYYGLMFQVSMLPMEKLRPIFDDVQWGTLERQLAFAVRLEPTLKEGGFVPDDQVAGAVTGRREQPSTRSVKPQG